MESIAPILDLLRWALIISLGGLAAAVIAAVICVILLVINLVKVWLKRNETLKEE